LYEQIVAEVNRNLAQYETIKNFLLVADEFTVADGQLTASMKMRRRAVEQRYRAQIEALYSNAERAFSERVPPASARAEVVTSDEAGQKVKTY
jgi:long-chain acyl-CoA synthetase